MIGCLYLLYLFKMSSFSYLFLSGFNQDLSTKFWFRLMQMFLEWQNYPCVVISDYQKSTLRFTHILHIQLNVTYVMDWLWVNYS